VKPKPYYDAVKRLTLAGGLLLFAGGFQVALADQCVEGDPDFNPAAAADPSICPPPTNTDPNNPPPTDGTDPNNPPPTDGTDPNNPPPTDGTDPNNPPPTDGTDPNNPPPTDGTDPNNPPPTDGTDPNNPPPTDGTDPNNPPPTDGTDPNNPPPTDGTDPNNPPPNAGGCVEDPNAGVFCDPFGHQVCDPKAAFEQPARCTSFGICIFDPSKNLYCDEFGGQLCFPDEELGIECNCEEAPERGLFCSAEGKPICEETPDKGIFCDDVPPACINDPDNGLSCDANHKQVYEVACVPDETLNITCDATGQTCVNTGGREVCQNDFNIDTFDENNFEAGELRFIDDEEKMQKLPPDFFTKLKPDEFEQFRDDALGHMNSQQVAQLPPEVFEKMDGQELFNFAPDVFDDFKPEQIANMPGNAFAGLTAVQFNKFDDDDFGAMKDEQIRQLPPEVFGGIDEDKFFKLPPTAFDDLDKDDCESLPPSIFGKMDADKMGRLGEHCLMGMEDEDFQLLPEEALTGLNIANLAGLPPRVLTDFTPEKFKKLNPETLGKLRDERPFDMMEIACNLTTIAADGIDAADIDLVDEYLPPGITVDPETGEFVFAEEATFEGDLPFPEFEFREEELFGDLAGRVTYIAPPDMNKGFGLGGQGRSGVELLDEVLPGFKFSQDDEGFLELKGEGVFAGVEVDLVVLGTKRAPKGKAPSVEIDPVSGAYIVTTSNGLEFELSLGAPSVSCMAKGIADHDLNYTNEHVAIFKPKTTTGTSTGRRIDIGENPVPIIGGGYTIGRRAATSGMSIFPATQAGDRPFGTLTYGDDIGDPTCSGKVQTVYPTLPDPTGFIEMLVSMGFAKEDLVRHVNGSIRLLVDIDGNGEKEIFEIVPDFPSASTNIARGKVEEQRLAMDTEGNFMLDDLNRFQYKYPYDGELLTIPLALLPVINEP